MGHAPKNTKNENKIDLDLIPWGLIAKYLTPAYVEGLIKYYRESWKLGFTTSEMFAGTMRHLIAYRDGENYDSSAEELGIIKHHLGGALFCILCLLDTFDNHPELDDRGKDHKPVGWCPDIMLEQIEAHKANKKNTKNLDQSANINETPILLHKNESLCIKCGFGHIVENAMLRSLHCTFCGQKYKRKK